MRFANIMLFEEHVGGKRPLPSLTFSDHVAPSVFVNKFLKQVIHLTVVFLILLNLE
jgi:hypothetical protein